MGSASGASLLVHALAESLAALPQLADERDRDQVEGISRLAKVLQVRRRSPVRSRRGRAGSGHGCCAPSRWQAAGLHGKRPAVVCAESLHRSLAGPQALRLCPALSSHRRAPPALQESTVGQRQTSSGDWFKEQGQAEGSGGGGAPWDSAAASLQTAAGILQWVVTEAEVGTGPGGTPPLLAGLCSLNFSVCTATPLLHATIRCAGHCRACCTAPCSTPPPPCRR